MFRNMCSAASAGVSSCLSRVTILLAQLSYTRFILYPCYTAIAVSHMRLRTHTETQTRATQCVSVCKNRNKCLTKLMLFMCLYVCEGVLTLASCSLKVFVLSI